MQNHKRVFFGVFSAIVLGAAACVAVEQDKGTSTDPQEAAIIEANLNRLSKEDRDAIKWWKTCEIDGVPLGAKGVPVKTKSGLGLPMFVCCEECRQEAERRAKIEAAIRALPAADRSQIDEQCLCPVCSKFLDHQELPIKVVLDQRTVFVCSEPCRKKAEADPAKAADIADQIVKQLARPFACYCCPMHLSIMKSDADKKCPICFLPLPRWRVRFSPNDTRLLQAQGSCPIDERRLDSLSRWVRKNDLDGKTVFFCCAKCEVAGMSQVDETREKAAELQAAERKRRHDELKELSEADRALAIAQGYCPIASLTPLGKKPFKITIQGRTVFLCCEGCKEEALKAPEQTLQKLNDFQRTVPGK